MAFVQALYQGLVENQRNLWIDWGEDSNPNDQWLTEIQNAIDCTDVILFIVSPESFRSQVCWWMLDYALSHEKRIIPVVCKPGDYELARPQLASMNWVHFTNIFDMKAPIKVFVF